MTLYKYLLFQGDNHYPYGGMDDLVLKFNTYEEFISNYNFCLCSWYQLVYTEDFSYVEFTSKILWHIDKESRDEIISKRKPEFLEWVKLNVNE